MSGEKVIVTISKKDGKITFDCNGFTGEGCASIEAVENAVGSVVAKTDKDERYQYELRTPIMQGVTG
jgi:hypothetical protein